MLIRNKQVIQISSNLYNLNLQTIWAFTDRNDICKTLDTQYFAEQILEKNVIHK